MNQLVILAISDDAWLIASLTAMTIVITGAGVIVTIWLFNRSQKQMSDDNTKKHLTAYDKELSATNSQTALIGSSLANLGTRIEEFSNRTNADREKLWSVHTTDAAGLVAQGERVAKVEQRVDEHDRRIDNLEDRKDGK